MAKENDKITLAGKTYKVRPLTLRQLKECLPIFEKVQGAGAVESIDASAIIIAAGLARTEPEITAEAILDLEATLPEILAAVGVIALVSGLVKAGEAAAAPASTGKVSTAA